MKETLAGENDRKTASPTESAVSGKRYREHSGAGCLNKNRVTDIVSRGLAAFRNVRAARRHALSAGEDRPTGVRPINAGGTADKTAYSSRDAGNCIPGFFVFMETSVREAGMPALFIERSIPVIQK